MKAHLGIDDTDSKYGGCTTYAAARLVELLLKKKSIFHDYPNLIRLNPNIPWKTRGNGAVALRFSVDDPKAVFDEVCGVIMSEALRDGGANPAVVMCISEEIPEDLTCFTAKALDDVVSAHQALRIIGKHRMRHFTVGSSMGLAGALAAVGEPLRGDHTYELIAYRMPYNCGRKRLVEPSSVVEMAARTFPHTFNNYDSETGRVLITPRGPDPVLFGIRGEEPRWLLKAYRMVKTGEEAERYLIFRSNQGTGVHLLRELEMRRLKAYTAGRVSGGVEGRPTAGIGGHVYFTLKRGVYEVPCAVYEPAGDLRRVALELIPGDFVEVGGGVRKRTLKHPSILNVEYIRVISLQRKVRLVNPGCAGCGRRMASMGRGQGFRCPKCGHKEAHLSKIEMEAPRSVAPGLYLPPPRAQRHLTKPAQRYGLEKCSAAVKMEGPWFALRPALEKAEGPPLTRWKLQESLPLP